MAITTHAQKEFNDRQKADIALRLRRWKDLADKERRDVDQAGTEDDDKQIRAERQTMAGAGDRDDVSTGRSDAVRGVGSVDG